MVWGVIRGVQSIRLPQKCKDMQVDENFIPYLHRLGQYLKKSERSF